LPQSQAFRGGSFRVLAAIKTNPAAVPRKHIQYHFSIPVVMATVIADGAGGGEDFQEPGFNFFWQTGVNLEGRVALLSVVVQKNQTVFGFQTVYPSAFFAWYRLIPFNPL